MNHRIRPTEPATASLSRERENPMKTAAEAQSGLEEAVKGQGRPR
jgi:hypothetical protein